MNKGKFSKELNRINARGLYNGWHAQQLQRRAQVSMVTMNVLFQNDRRGVSTSAYNVPGKAIAIDSVFVTYEFLDGSTGKYPHGKYAK